MDNIISRFQGEYEFLSNFYQYQFEYNGLMFLNAEAAFQSAKTLDPALQREFCELHASKAKALGRRVGLRPDWEDIKIDVMYGVLSAKFKSGQLVRLLRLTRDAILIEGNTWHDNFWGDCICPKCSRIEGANNLGNLLMQIRLEKYKEKVQKNSVYGGSGVTVYSTL